MLDQTGTINSFNAAMEALGYRPRGECLNATVPGTPGRFYFSKDRNGSRTHQVHVCADGHPEIADKLAFRDYVRAHPVEAAAYGELKQWLALAHSDDNIGYMLGKDAFVKSLLAAARLGTRRVKRCGPKATAVGQAPRTAMPNERVKSTGARHIFD